MKLGEIAFFVTDKISSTSISLEEYVTTDSLLQDKKGRTLASNLPPNGCSITRFEKDDILVANIRPYLKKVWKADISGGASNDVLVFRAEDGVPVDFLYAVLLQDSFYDHVMLAPIGAKMPRGEKNHIMRYEIQGLTNESQEFIGSLMSSLDRKISLNRKANEVLESMAKQLYDYWFVQFDFPNAEGKPYKSSGGKMVYNETLKSDIPEGWEVKTLSEIGSFKNGVNYDPNEPGNTEYRIVNVRNVSSTSLLIDSSDLDVLLLDESKASTYLIKEGDILITRSGNPGATRSYCECDIPAVYCGFIICFSPSFAIHRKYLLMFLKDREIITSRLKGGSIMPNISQDALKPVLVPIPDTDVLKRFEESIVPIISKLQANISEIKHLTSLRDYLLPLLMNGQVKVS